MSTFSQNDAGFQYVVDKKGADDYARFLEQLRQRARQSNGMDECHELMQQYLRYFRTGHQFVRANESDNSTPTKRPSDDEVRAKYADTRTVNLTEQQLIQKLAKKKDTNPAEGIWTNGTYTVGMLASDTDRNELTGFILKADGLYWLPKQVKVELTADSSGVVYDARFYMRDHSMQRSTANFVSAQHHNLLNLNNTLFTRVYPAATLSPEEQLAIDFQNIRQPFVRRLSSQTLYLRIPSFAPDQKAVIDKLLASNDSLLCATPNLIIDIREGTGGGDASFSNLIPYLYTNPIRGLGVEFYATEQNAKGFDRYASMFYELKDTARAQFCERVATEMRAQLGTFFTPTSFSKVGVHKLDSVLPYPQRVAILCNRHNGSTDEEFLLTAKQSWKVKVFGEPTLGSLDISNMTEVTSPDGLFTLGYCMSRSFRIPDFCIDDVGIQPDFFIDRLINPYGWVEYVREMIE